MKRGILTAVGIAVLSFASGAMGVFTAADIIAGDGTPPRLRLWGFEDLSGQAPIYAGKTVRGDDTSGSLFYTLIPPGETGPSAPLGVAVRQEGSGGAVGAYFYAENEGGGDPVWAANAIARTYNGRPAVGMEINGINDSGEFALVRGLDIINGGSAETQWGLGILTGGWGRAGQPRYGIVLGGPRWGAGAAPASRTGVLIDHIDSGEAIQIAAGDFITLDGGRGRIRMRYNPDEERIEFYNGRVLAHTIAMAPAGGD